jgi:hypothetical protein
MFPACAAKEISPAAIDALMTVLDRGANRGDNPGIPAGFTYLGQFIDHDLTFDPTPQSQKTMDRDAVFSFRTPRLDLDSLYGSGPKDQPFLYEYENADNRGVKLLIGEAKWFMRMKTLPDLPRNSEQRALIGDPRNDENMIVAQLHLLFLRFHNKVVDHLRARQPDLRGAALFEEARRWVRWHYQWIVVNDFLRRVVGAALLTEVLRARRTFTHDNDVPFIPVEFSGAAYRFGHSMVRGSYSIGPRQTNVPIFAAEGSRTEHLGGLRSFQRKLEIDWSRFFASGPREPQASLLIDTDISQPLRSLPATVADAAVAGGSRPSLPRLNLMRAHILGVPPGQAVAKAMKIAPLNASQLKFETFAQEIRDELMAATPLWYYVLCEAEAPPSDGQQLGPVGGGIVAETLVGLLVSDSQSYLAAAPSWTPELPGAAKDDFTMADLVRFTG